MQKPFNIWPCLAMLLLLSTSCLSNKQTVLMQDSDWKSTQATVVNNDVGLYRLQVNDVVSVRIKSLNKEQTEHINIQPDNVMNINSAATFINGYSINDQGYIQVPSIGKVKIEGLTIHQARDLVQSRADEEFKGATAIVSLMSFKISVLGEVRKPGYFYIYNNQLNLMEALAMAGDLDDYADLTRVHLIRQRADGSESILMDLTDPGILANPFYYLQPNDVVYVPPISVKNNRHNLANVTVLNAIFSGVTTSIAVISLIISNQRFNEGN